MVPFSLIYTSGECHKFNFRFHHRVHSNTRPIAFCSLSFQTVILLIWNNQYTPASVFTIQIYPHVDKWESWNWTHVKRFKNIHCVGHEVYTINGFSDELVAYIEFLRFNNPVRKFALKTYYIFKKHWTCSTEFALWSIRRNTTTLNNPMVYRPTHHRLCLSIFIDFNFHWNLECSFGRNLRHWD